MSRPFAIFAFLVAVLCSALALADPEDILPTDKCGGWKLTGEPRIYYPETLYEYIDGAAETYLDFGFVKLAVGEYRNPETKDCSIIVDIYDMGEVNNAFGIYATGLYPDANFIKVGVQGYTGEGSIEFWKDRYYIKVTAYGEAPRLAESTLQLARAVAANIKAEAVMPQGTKMFPEQGLVPNSFKYMRQNGLGQSFIRHAFLADYKRKGKELQLLIAQYQKANEAREALEKFKTFVKKMGKIKSEDTDRFIGEDPYYETIVVQRVGKFLLCTLRTTDTALARELLDEAIGRLPQK